jgi:hypothetical protein
MQCFPTGGTILSPHTYISIDRCIVSHNATIIMRAACPLLALLSKYVQNVSQQAIVAMMQTLPSSCPLTKNTFKAFRHSPDIL